jgi:hypothetical protein
MIVLIEEKKIPNLKIYVKKESKHVEYCKKGILILKAVSSIQFFDH